MGRFEEKAAEQQRMAISDTRAGLVLHAAQVVTKRLASCSDLQRAPGRSTWSAQAVPTPGVR